MRWVPIECIAGGANVVAGADEAGMDLSEPLEINFETAQCFMAAVKASGVTSTTGIFAKIYQSRDGGATYTAIPFAQVAITANGTYHLGWQRNAGSGAFPTWPHVKVVLTSGAGDAATIESVKYCRVRQ